MDLTPQKFPISVNFSFGYYTLLYSTRELIAFAQNHYSWTLKKKKQSTFMPQTGYSPDAIDEDADDFQWTWITLICRRQKTWCALPSSLLLRQLSKGIMQLAPTCSTQLTYLTAVRYPSPCVTHCTSPDLCENCLSTDVVGDIETRVAGRVERERDSYKSTGKPERQKPISAGAYYR